jgi:hypothetical protein
LLRNSTYPCPTSIQCTIDDIGDYIVTVSTRWLTGGPDDTPVVFDVRLDALIPDPDLTT